MNEEGVGGGVPNASSGTTGEAQEQPQAKAEPQPQRQDHHQPPSLQLEDVIDDFSLPSRGMRFRAGSGREIRIYEQAHGQLIMEQRTDRSGADDEEQVPQDDDDDDDDDGKHKDRGKNGIIVRSSKDNGYAFSFLRATYSLMAVFVGGFLFILGFCILLFLFIDLAILLGLTSDDHNDNLKPLDFISVILSLPLFVYSLAMGMTLATRFVIDTFYGHPFLRSFGLGVATTEWIAFSLYLGIPSLVFIVTLFLGLENWWEISLLSWFASILTFWGFFSACELFLEIWACLKIMEEDENTSLIDEDPWEARVKYWLAKAGNACVQTTRYRMAGTHIHFKRVQMDTRLTVMEDNKIVNNCINCISQDFASEGPYSYFANKKWNPCFDQTEHVKRASLQDVLGDKTYVTRDSWSLEKLFCRKKGVHSSIPITQGPASITEAQINSNIACNLLGNLIIALLFTGFVMWLNPPDAALGILTILIIIFFSCVGFRTYRLVALRKDVISDDSPTLYRYWERWQYSTPKLNVVRAAICLEVLFLYLLPLIYLSVQNPPSATLFSFLGLFSAVRHYLNPRVLLLEKDRKDYFEKRLPAEKKEWKRKHLLYNIVSVGGDAARHFWSWVYILCVIFFTVIVIMAAKGTASDSSHYSENNDRLLVDGYKYYAQPHLAYPTCRLKKGFNGNDFELGDFAFMSFLAYTTPNKTQNFLNQWFGAVGENVAINNETIVEEFKASEEYKTYKFGSSVSYKLVVFSTPYAPGAVLTIRGTQTVFDLMTDAQLWIAAGLFQGLRFFLPFSEVFTPILKHMVYIVNQLETTAIQKVSYYRETSGFVNYLKNVKGLDNIQVTGHSLGGGLAIITGPQTKTNAVAISGVNAMLSRDTFIPNLDPYDLDTLTFNVVPDRDPIPMIDDKARLYQNINCTASTSDIVGCHDILRSVCEIQYTCGSENRPVFCECVLKYNYPEPTRESTTTDQTKTFTQQCIDLCKTNAKNKNNMGYTDKMCLEWEQNANSR